MHHEEKRERVGKGREEEGEEERRGGEKGGGSTKVKNEHVVSVSHPLICS